MADVPNGVIVLLLSLCAVLGTGIYDHFKKKEAMQDDSEKTLRKLAAYFSELGVPHLIYEDDQTLGIDAGFANVIIGVQCWENELSYLIAWCYFDVKHLESEQVSHICNYVTNNYMVTKCSIGSEEAHLTIQAETYFQGAEQCAKSTIRLISTFRDICREIGHRDFIAKIDAELNERITTNNQHTS